MTVAKNKGIKGTLLDLWWARRPLAVCSYAQAEAPR
jgi:hypothetical protein